MDEQITSEQIEIVYRAQVAKLLSKNPEIPDEYLLKFLTNYMWSSGRIAEALACMRLLEQREELTPAELNLRGYWQLYVGDSTSIMSAKKTFERALAQDASDKGSRLGYAYALFFLEDYSHAANIFQKLADEGDFYLFCWDEIPGNDSQKLMEFLSLEFGIDWVKPEKIMKIEDGRTIRITKGKNYLSLRLNDERTKIDFEINVQIDGVRSDKFIARMENGKLNIYFKILHSPQIMAAACRAKAVGQNPQEIKLPPLPGIPPKVSEIMQIKLLYGPDTAIEKALSILESLEQKTDWLPIMRLLIELKLEEKQEVIELIDDSLMNYPNDGTLWLFKGIALRQLGDKQSSHECFSKAVEFAPFDPRTWGGFGAGWLELKDFENAVKAYRIATFLDENYPFFWADLGLAEYSQGNYHVAINAISRAIELGMQNFANYYNRGMCFLYLSELQSALRDWNYAIALEPNNVRVEEVRKLIRDIGVDDGFVFGEIDE